MGVVLAIIGVISVLLLIPSVSYACLRPGRIGVGAANLIAFGCVVALGALPFLLPRGAYFWRSCLATFAVSGAVKIVELKNGRLSDTSVQHRFGRFWLWSIVPPDTRWPRNDVDLRNARARGSARLGRCAFKVACFVGLMIAGKSDAASGVSYPISVVWTATQFYLFMTSILDGISAATLLGGVDVDEIFDRPFFARSPSDFWSRRWNLYISRFAARYVFTPLGGVRRRAVAILAVFAASALMHEYLVLAIFWRDWRKLGYMSLFFGLQGLAVLVHHGWLGLTRGRLRLNPPLAIVLHTLWFLPTTTLFFEPLGPLLHLWGVHFRPLPG